MYTGVTISHYFLAVTTTVSGSVACAWATKTRRSRARGKGSCRWRWSWRTRGQRARRDCWHPTWIYRRCLIVSVPLAIRLRPWSCLCSAWYWNFVSNGRSKYTCKIRHSILRLVVVILCKTHSSIATWISTIASNFAWVLVFWWKLYKNVFFFIIFCSSHFTQERYSC